MNVADIEEKNITTPKNKPDFNPESNTESSSVKVGTNLLLSTILPGWGLTRLSEGKPYWLIGIAGTGCIVSSVYFNSLAVSNYNDYLSSTDSGKRGSYFDTSKRNFTVSKVCAWSAVAIWAVDLGVLGLKASKMKKTASVNRLKSLSIESKFDYLSSTHQLSVCYKF